MYEKYQIYSVKAYRFYLTLFVKESTVQLDDIPDQALPLNTDSHGLSPSKTQLLPASGIVGQLSHRSHKRVELSKRNQRANLVACNPTPRRRRAGRFCLPACERRAAVCRPSVFGMYARRTGFARYAPRFSRADRSWRFAYRAAPYCCHVSPSMPAAASRFMAT